MSLSRKFLSYIFDNQLFTRQDRLLLALSGGVDSVVLAHLLHRNHLDFGIAHCNFGLRGEESDHDESFAKNLADQLGVPFFCQKFDTQNYAEERKLTIQVAARNLRYAWFDEVLEQSNYQFVLTAHQANDLFETALYNLVKGTGIAGLRGFLPKNGKIVRPLFFAKRQDILEFAQFQALAWREDSSNEKDDYSRNYLRHQVVPLLRKLNPELEQTFLMSAERLRATEFFLQKEIESFEKQAVSEKGKSIWISIGALEQTEEPVFKLYEILKKHHFSYERTKKIWEHRDAQSGKLFFSRNHSLAKDRDCFVLLPKKQKGLAYEILEVAEQEIDILEVQKSLKIRYLENIKWEEMPKTPNKIWLDAARIAFPLQLRYWQEGDRFCPLGMNGKQKKVGDLLTNLKTPANIKKQTLILESSGEIVWVLGYRLDERAKISETTQNVWEMEIE